MTNISTTATVSAVPVCPRCDGPIGNAQQGGAYPGALSRYDNSTHVCALCGFKEAIAQMNGALPPVQVRLPDLAPELARIFDSLDVPFSSASTGASLMPHSHTSVPETGPALT